MSLSIIRKPTSSCTVRALCFCPTTISSFYPSLSGASLKVSHLSVSSFSHLPLFSPISSTSDLPLSSSVSLTLGSNLPLSCSFSCTAHFPRSSSCWVSSSLPLSSSSWVSSRLRIDSFSSNFSSSTSSKPSRKRPENSENQVESSSSSCSVSSSLPLSSSTWVSSRLRIDSFSSNFSSSTSSKPSRKRPENCENQVESSVPSSSAEPDSEESTIAQAAISGARAQHLTPEKRGQWKLMNSAEKGAHSIPVLSTVTNGHDAAAVQQMEKPVSMWPGMYHSPVTAALWAARSSIIERQMDFSMDGHPQRQLLTRTPSQSRTSILYSLSSDKILQEQYRNPWSAVRIGKLLEDLDALAGTIAVKHCADDDHTTRPLMLVTASVDKISLLKPIRITEDITISGAVAWVGRSSMEIRMEITQAPHPDNEQEEDALALVANFTFVARDTITKKAAQINRLAPETEAEKTLFQLGEAADAKRKEQRASKNEDSKVAKALHDDQRLKDLMTEGRVLREMPTLADRNMILMKNTKQENAIICQPQQRNMHGRIFGGFLMRRAYELAYSTCYVFCGILPVFLEVDHVDFLRPVDVGDLLRFKSFVLYTEAKTQLIHIEVTAHVTQPELRTSEISNTFYFTFALDSSKLNEATPPLFRVVPGTEEEARRVLARYDAENLAKYPLLEKQLSQKSHRL